MIITMTKIIMMMMIVMAIVDDDIIMVVVMIIIVPHVVLWAVVRAPLPIVLVVVGFQLLIHVNGQS